MPNSALNRALQHKRAREEQQQTVLVQAKLPPDMHERARLILNRHALSWGDFIKGAVLELIENDPGGPAAPPGSSPNPAGQSDEG